MKDITPQVNKTSITSVSKLSSATTSAGGLKSNNGIENAVSAVEGKERSEAILETLFAFGIEHAQEFANRTLDAEDRWWQRANEKSMIGQMTAAKKAQGAAGAAGALSGLGAGLGAAVGGLLAKKSQENEEEKDINGQTKPDPRLAHMQEDGKKTLGPDGKVIENKNIETQNLNNQTEGFLTNNEAQEQSQEVWQEQNSYIKDATDPEEVFG